jgi:hypothetical protein
MKERTVPNQGNWTKPLEIRGNCPEKDFYGTKGSTNKNERASIGRFDAPTPAKETKSVSNPRFTGQRCFSLGGPVSNRVRDKPL